MKTIISILLAIMIQLATVTGSVTTITEKSEDALYDDNEIVNVIVELEDKSLLEGVKNSSQREKLLENFETSEAYQKIVTAQETLKTKIANKFSKADFSSSYSYSFVTNGFSLSIPYKYVSKLEGLSGVKNVEVSASFDAPTASEEEDSLIVSGISGTAMENEGKFTGVNNAHEKGYTGKGTVVAVIDTGFDIDHEAFANGVEQPSLSKKDINVLTTFGCLNTIVPVYKHYVSEKIPYKWDYSKVDSDVSNPNSEHGTHVAGIVAGDSEVLTGVAPDAQLLLMKVFGDKEGSKAEEYIYLAAMDDAVKLGADTLNLSLSSPSGQQPSNIVTATVLKRLEKSGINVVCSAGNEASTGYYDSTAGSNTVSADIFDYGTVGSPSTYEWSMSVASSTINSRTSIYDEAINVTGVGSQNISSFSAWGVSADLKLKPEIIAPGSYIYSSVPGNTYASLSGTSMSAPYFAGCYAVTKQYVNENYPSIEKKQSAEFINSILMSTATPFRGYAQPAVFSPRRQGAGLVNLDGALSTKAYLTTTSNTRPKLDLGEDTDGTLEMSFVVNNMSSDELNYKLQLVPLADSYKLENGKYVNTLTAKKISTKDYTLEYVSGINEDGTVTVAPNGKTTVSIKLTFSESFLDGQAKAFVNGFFLDGYVYLKDTSGNEPTLSIPYLAFDGDWNKDMLFDNTMYSGTPSYLGKQWGLYVTDGDNYYPLGANMFETEKEYDIDTKYCAYSTKALSSVMEKPYVTACVGLLRNAKRVDFNLFTEGGVFRYCGSTLLDYQRKTYYPENPVEGLLWGGKSGLINGQSYVYKVSTTAQNYDSGRETLSFPFVVDNNAPVISSLTYQNVDGKNILKIKISDNHYVQGFKVLTAENKLIGSVSFKGIDAVDGSYEYELDVTTLAGRKFGSQELESINIYTVDYAYNEAYATISLEDNAEIIEDVPALIPSDYASHFEAETVVVESTTTTVSYGSFDKVITKLQNALEKYN